MFTGALRGIYRTNLGVDKSERVLVFTDKLSKREGPQAQADVARRERLPDIMNLMAETGRSIAKEVVSVTYTAGGAHGKEPPRALWEAAFGPRAVADLDRAGVLPKLLAKRATESDMLKAEAIVAKRAGDAVDAVIALSNYSTSHTRFRDLLSRIAGTRYASMPLFDASMLEGAMDVDWRALAKRTRSVAKAVNMADMVEIETPNGTYISFSIKGRRALADTGLITRKGAFGNLPAGEAYLAPVEGTAEGRLVVEWAPTRMLKKPITLTVKGGLVTGVSGTDPYAIELEKRLTARRENRNIAELGIGTNDRARRPDNILESEKILGTIHIAFGDNSSFGGVVKTPFHQDFVFFRPTLVLRLKTGGRATLIEDGRLLLPS